MKRTLQKRLTGFMQLGLFALCLLISSTSYAQYTGTVLDGDTDEPLIGATILISGTSTGTITDFDGKFSIDAKEGDILDVSYTGYSSQQITVGAEKNLAIRLGQGVLIEEVVVTGYSVDSRRQTPGSVATVKAEDLQVIPSGNVEQQLQGRVSGVTVISNGQPGTTSQVRIRGYGALGGNAPLYVVDGVAVGSIDFLSPDDIESTTVLKDASAASIYGARAAGGVIVYTTKQGKKGKRKMTVTYDGMVGVTDPGTGAPVLDPQGQADWTWNAIRNAATNNGEDPVFDHPQYGTGDTPVVPDFIKVGNADGVVGTVDLNAEAANYNIDPNAGAVYQVVAANKAGTDWYDEITRSALLNRHNLGFSGGVENGRYFFGVGMQDQQGILNNQSFQRYTFRANSEFDLLPSLRFGENIQVTYRATNLLLGDAGGSSSSDDENFVLDASRMSPIIPVMDEFGGWAGTRANGLGNPRNPVAAIDGIKDNRGYQTGIFGNAYLEFEPIENLVFRTSFGGNFASGSFFGFNRLQYENQENNAAFGFNTGSFNGTSWQWTNTANYKRTFGKSKIDVLVGQEALSFGKGRNIFASGLNPFSTSPDFVQINTVESPQVFGGHSNPITFASVFGRLNYEYNDKYILSGVVRRDGSSRFGSESRYGVFPAVSAAWRISSESFMANASAIDDMKLRVGYGIMGNSNNVDPSNQFSTFGPSIGNSSYDLNGTNSGAIAGFYATRNGNPFAQWERAITSNIGLDVLLFDGKWDIGVELWNKKTEDLLFRAPQTVMIGGFAQSPSVNVGEMLNRGIDLQIGNKGRIGEVKYDVVLTGGFLKNEIVTLADGLEDLPDRSVSYRGITPVLNQVGEPLSTFYGYDVVGIYANDAEVENGAVQEGAAPGRFQFRDVDGNDTINIDDRISLGNPIPDFTGGITIKLNYKAFELNVFGYASIGNEIYNVSKLFTDFYPLFPGSAISERVLDSWTFDNPTGEIPLFENAANFSTTTQSNSYYVEDGSYFRLQNVTLAYNLPNDIIDRWNLSKFRIFAGVNNLLTISGYSGLDPSVGGAADTNFGIDLGNYPITRSFTFGLNLGF